MWRKERTDCEVQRSSLRKMASMAWDRCSCGTSMPVCTTTPPPGPPASTWACSLDFQMPATHFMSMNASQMLILAGNSWSSSAGVQKRIADPVNSSVAG